MSIFVFAVLGLVLGLILGLVLIVMMPKGFGGS
jgi:hypothetical protein